MGKPQLEQEGTSPRQETGEEKQKTHNRKLLQTTSIECIRSPMNFGLSLPCRTGSVMADWCRIHDLSCSTEGGSPVPHPTPFSLIPSSVASEFKPIHSAPHITLQHLSCSTAVDIIQHDYLLSVLTPSEITLQHRNLPILLHCPPGVSRSLGKRCCYFDLLRACRALGNL